MKRGDDFRSLSGDAEVFSVTLDEAVELFRQEKPSRRGGSRQVLRELGAHPDSGQPVRLLEGRYGPYVTDGTTNASLPKDLAADAMTLDAAVALLKAREGAKPRGRGRRTTSGRTGSRPRRTKRTAAGERGD